MEGIYQEKGPQCNNCTGECFFNGELQCFYGGTILEVTALAVIEYSYAHPKGRVVAERRKKQ